MNQFTWDPEITGVPIAQRNLKRNSICSIILEFILANNPSTVHTVQRNSHRNIIVLNIFGIFILIPMEFKIEHLFYLVTDKVLEIPESSQR